MTRPLILSSRITESDDQFQLNHAVLRREALDEAIAESGVAGYEEIDILDPDTPEDLRGWGSPTILVNGADVTGNAKGEGAGCRIYTTESRVPEAELIVERIKDAQLPHG